MLIGPQNLAENLRFVRSRIAAAAHAAGRAEESVTIVAVSKAQPVSAIDAARNLGLADFGESYPQEARPKIEALLAREITWHFIGHLQTNKTRPVASLFSWVHSVDRSAVARRLSDQRPFHAPPLNVCLQVKLADEAGKSGAEPEELERLAREVASLPRLRLRGLMCIPPPESEPERQRSYFRRTREVFEQLRARGYDLDCLSMGMSGDYQAAVAEGATHLRIGTALFGPRPEE
jgi:pyridoxal phosphate enzyme (YggS family)